MRARGVAFAEGAVAAVGRAAAQGIRQSERRRVRAILPDGRAAADDAGLSRPEAIGGGPMRPAGKGPLDSLYFTYPIFPARRVPELDGATVRHPVAIVGAGPIGMTAALVLARYGVRSVLLDRKDTFNDGSRALCIARVSMHILERI